MSKKTNPEPERHFFEIDEITSHAVQLAKWTGGLGPCGGPVVYAVDARQASELYRAWKYGPGLSDAFRARSDAVLAVRSDVTVDGHTWRNVIW